MFVNQTMSIGLNLPIHSWMTVQSIAGYEGKNSCCCEDADQ